MLIGADNLNIDALKEILVLSGLQGIEFVHKESGRPRGKWDLLKTLFKLFSLEV
jgi:hypothetical protein